MNKQLEPVLIIVGPTGAGKTSLSIALAKRFNGEVISADARQVYRTLNIGTEKVTAEEMGSIPHHLIDVVEVDTVYTAADFARDATQAVQEIRARDHLPIIAGGSFFYIDAFLGRVTLPPVPPNEELRQQLSEASTEELLAHLTRLDPQRAATVDQQNPRRLLRAIEIATALGSVPPAEVPTPTYDTLSIGLTVDRTELRERLTTRAAAALERGLVTETQALLARGVSRTRLMEIGLEYRIVIEALEEGVNDTILLERLAAGNWQYAKRQLTWLRRDSNVHWFNPSDQASIEAKVEQWLTERSGR